MENVNCWVLVGFTGIRKGDARSISYSQLGGTYQVALVTLL